MTETPNAHIPFTPDWALPPGESILELMEERGWKQTELANRLGYSEKYVDHLMHGKVVVTPDAAQKLANVFDNSLEFWLSLEANYQKHKARLEVARRQAA